jgi:hypothetical protein
VNQVEHPKTLILIGPDILLSLIKTALRMLKTDLNHRYDSRGSPRHRLQDGRVRRIRNDLEHADGRSGILEDDLDVD